jgi:hypothetical protein
LLNKLKEDPVFGKHPVAKKGLEEMTLLLDYLEVLGVMPDVS